MNARAAWRISRVGALLLTGACIALYLALRTRLGRRPAWAPRAARWWHGRLCRALGLRLRVIGAPEPGCVLAANHVSWLDIPILGAQGEIGFLAKSEVRDWPLVGWMAAVAGTRFIVRGAHRTGQLTDELARAAQAGHGLALFPEGTTTDGRSLGRFHARLFRIVQGTGLRIQPVAIRYRHGADPTPDPRACYIGADTLIASLWRIVRHPDLVAELRFLAPIAVPDGLPRRVLAERTRAAIAAALDPRFDPPAPVPKRASVSGALQPA